MGLEGQAGQALTQYGGDYWTQKWMVFTGDL